MENPEFLIVGIVVLGATAIGLTAWLLRYLVKGDGQEEEPEPAEEEPVKVAEPPPAADPAPRPEPVAASPESMVPEAPSLQPAPRASRPGDVLLMQVWQDQEGFLILEVQGQRYRRLFDIRDGAIGRSVLETINRLVLFSKGKEARVAPASPTPTLFPEGKDEEEKARELVEQLQEPSAAQSRKPRISMDPVPFRRQSVAQEASITLDLAGEIDEILQKRLATLPELRQRYIRVVNAQDGGLRFDVDGKSYQSLEDIADSQVQAAIRASISDWEARQ